MFEAQIVCPYCGKPNTFKLPPKLTERIFKCVKCGFELFVFVLVSLDWDEEKP